MNTRGVIHVHVCAIYCYTWVSLIRYPVFIGCTATAGCTLWLKRGLVLLFYSHYKWDETKKNSWNSMLLLSCFHAFYISYWFLTCQIMLYRWCLTTVVIIFGRLVPEVWVAFPLHLKRWKYLMKILMKQKLFFIITSLTQTVQKKFTLVSLC